MGSRLGSRNKDKQALRDLAAKHGVDVVEMQMMICADLKKTYDNEKSKPRSRRSKQFFEAEDKLIKVTQELTPYVAGKLSNITVTDETPRLTVIRAPEPVGDSQAWLAKFSPNRDDNEVPAVRALRVAMDRADQLDVTDPDEIVSEAIKHGKMS